MTPLALFNFLWLSASLVLFGAALFPLYARTAPWREFLRGAATVLAISGVLAVSQHIVVLESSLGAIAQTGIGRTWITQIVIAVALTICTRTGPHWLTVLLAGAELTGFALVGHANAISGMPGALLEVAHLLAAGAWIGGAIALAQALGTADAASAVRRFSWVATLFVVVLGITGVAVLSNNTGWWLPMTATRYGQLATAKIILFAAALACAAFNRFFATPRSDWRVMARVIAGEFAILLMIVAAAVWLAQTEPYG